MWDTVKHIVDTSSKLSSAAMGATAKFQQVHKKIHDAGKPTLSISTK